MLFNSMQFIVFFIFVFFAYFSIPQKYRWIFLLACSYYFYMCWKAEYIILIMLSTIIDYLAGINIEKAKTAKKRKLFLILSLITNLGLLFAFKYFNFFNESFRIMFGHFNLLYNVPAFNVLLPVGISFYTFQTLSYTIDVYRGKQKAEHHLGIFALYVSFFPQLVAGPIERSLNLLPQFYKNIKFDYVRVTDGLKLMMWGFFKKVVIADRLAVFVDKVYSTPDQFTSLPLIIATYFFAFQIYCDFSGYSDIAIGTAQILGFNLMDNFNRPYFSKSIHEFWKRWHISLSSWFKDYLYLPLGGNRVGKGRWYFNLFFVFLASGLWHGANWTFIVWGALHGFYLMFSLLTVNMRVAIVKFLGLGARPKIHKYIKIFITFHLVLLSWIFFRANSLTDAFQIIKIIFTTPLEFKTSYNLDFGIYQFTLAICSIIFMEFIHLIQRHASIRHMLKQQPLWLRWAIYIIMFFSILMFGQFTQQEFIYFQF